MLYQLLLLVILLPISFGPLARYGLNHATPDLFLIAAWLFAWLTNRNTALRWAVMAGLVIDLINYHFFGLWLITYIVIVLVIDYLKNRYFDVLSFIQAIICLLGANIIVLFVGYLSGANFSLLRDGLSIMYNTVIGICLYYILAHRFNFFSHWRGSNV